MRAEFARNTVKIAVRRLVAFELPRLVFKRVFERRIPRAFENLIRFFGDFRSVLSEIAFHEGEKAVFHFLFGRFPGEA